MKLAEIQRIKQWHIDHRSTHPAEFHVWDAVLTLWLTGWVGWLPTFALDALWGAPLCMLAIAAPNLYVRWRERSHRLHRVRCDWAADPGLLAGRSHVRR